ncbi:UrcA family protein [Povalibacter sp.]|uniref:UrcA family protein n=1 Tax=Povalibacter sp. TaxID=1962978 RepID=UPI002F3EDA72
MKTLTCLTATAVLTFAAMSAAYSADMPDGAKSLTVSFADLNLGTTAGAATLFGRIRAAAAAVCAAENGTALQQKTQYQACMAFAVSNAVAAVNSPSLAAYVDDRTAKRRAPVRIASSR